MRPKMITSIHKSLKKKNHCNSTEIKIKLRKKIHPEYYKLRHKSVLSKRKIAITLFNKIRLKKRAEPIKFTISVMKKESCLNEEKENNIWIKRSKESRSQTNINHNDIDFSQKSLILSPSDKIHCDNIKDDIFVAKSMNEKDIQQKKKYSIVNTEIKWTALDQSDDEVFAGPFNKKREWSISRNRTLVLEDDGEISEDTKKKSLYSFKRKLEFDQMNKQVNRDEEGFSINNECLKMKEIETIHDIGIMHVDKEINEGKEKISPIRFKKKMEFDQMNEQQNKDKGGFSIINGCSKMKKIENIDEIGMTDQLKNRDKYFSYLSEACDLKKEDYLKSTNLPEFQKISVVVDNDKRSNECKDLLNAEESSIQLISLRPEELSKFVQLLDEKKYPKDESKDCQVEIIYSEDEMETSQELKTLSTSEDSMFSLMIFDPQKFIRQIKKAQNRENNIMKDNIRLQKELCELKHNVGSVLERKNSLLEPEKSNLMTKKIQDTISKFKSKIKIKIYYMKKLQLNLNAIKTKQKRIIKNNKHLHIINKLLKHHKKQLNKNQKIFIKEKNIYGQDIKKLQSDFQRLKDLYSEMLVKCQKNICLLEINAELNYELQKTNVHQTQLEGECKHLNIEKNKLQENVLVPSEKNREIDYNKPRTHIFKRTTINVFDQFSDFYSSLPAGTYFPYIQKAMRDMITDGSFSNHSLVKKGAKINNNLLDSPENIEKGVGSIQCSELSPIMDENGFEKQNVNLKINQNKDKYLDVPLEECFEQSLKDIDKRKTKKKDRKNKVKNRLDSQSSANTKETRRSKVEKCKVENTSNTERIKDKFIVKKKIKNSKYRAQFNKTVEQNNLHTVVNKVIKEKINSDHLNYKSIQKKDEECVRNNIGTSKVKKYLNDTFFNDLPDIDFS